MNKEALTHLIAQLDMVQMTPEELQIFLNTIAESLSLPDSALTVVFFLRLAGESIVIEDERRRQLASLLLKVRAHFLSAPW